LGGKKAVLRVRLESAPRGPQGQNNRWTQQVPMIYLLQPPTTLLISNPCPRLQEDEALRAAQNDPAICGKWARIGRERFNGKFDGPHIRIHWTTVLQGGLLKGAFTPAEDDIILQEAQKHSTPLSTQDFVEIATKLAGRQTRQVSERYINHLDPRCWCLMCDVRCERISTRLGIRIQASAV
jgi:hypothetical protein